MGKKVGTVPPKEVNQAAIDANLSYPDQRLIIHYLQPHAPYLCLSNCNSTPVLNFHDLQVAIDSLRNGILQRLWKSLPQGNSFFTRMTWKIKKKMSRTSVTRPIDTELRKVGRDGLLKAYENNLKAVLKCTAELVKLLPGKKLITADHGELLGERGELGHQPSHHVSPLVEVPYFEISI